MSLIVEDGVTSGGVPNAESYCDVAFADTYWAGRNATSAAAWAALTTAPKEAALREACQYLDQGWEWIGTRWSGKQYLNWPRSIYPRGFSLSRVDINLSLPGINQIPLILKQAQCELALEAMSGKLSPAYDPTQTVESVTVGPLSVKYNSTSRGGSLKPNRRFPLITLLLKDISTSSNAAALQATATRG